MAFVHFVEIIGVSYRCLVCLAAVWFCSSLQSLYSGFRNLYKEQQTQPNNWLDQVCLCNQYSLPWLTRPWSSSLPEPNSSWSIDSFYCRHSCCYDPWGEDHTSQPQGPCISCIFFLDDGPFHCPFNEPLPYQIFGRQSLGTFPSWSHFLVLH